MRLLDCSKSDINWKDENKISWHDVIVNSFWRLLVSPNKSRYWFKFHVYIITGSGVIPIIFYEGLTINSEIKNTPAWLSSYSSYRFWFIKVKPTEGGKIPSLSLSPPSPTQIRVKQFQEKIANIKRTPTFENADSSSLQDPHANKALQVFMIISYLLQLTRVTIM